MSDRPTAQPAVAQAAGLDDGKYATGFRDQISELGANFEILGLADLGKFFGRE